MGIMPSVASIGHVIDRRAYAQCWMCAHASVRVSFDPLLPNIWEISHKVYSHDGSRHVAMVRISSTFARDLSCGGKPPKDEVALSCGAPNEEEQRRRSHGESSGNLDLKVAALGRWKAAVDTCGHRETLFGPAAPCNSSSQDTCRSSLSQDGCDPLDSVWSTRWPGYKWRQVDRQAYAGERRRLRDVFKDCDDGKLHGSCGLSPRTVRMFDGRASIFEWFYWCRCGYELARAKGNLHGVMYSQVLHMYVLRELWGFVDILPFCKMKVCLLCYLQLLSLSQLHTLQALPR